MASTKKYESAGTFGLFMLIPWIIMCAVLFGLVMLGELAGKNLTLAGSFPAKSQRFRNPFLKPFLMLRTCSCRIFNILLF